MHVLFLIDKIQVQRYKYTHEVGGRDTNKDILELEQRQGGMETVLSTFYYWGARPGFRLPNVELNYATYTCRRHTLAVWPNKSLFQEPKRNQFFLASLVNCSHDYHVKQDVDPALSAVLPATFQDATDDEEIARLLHQKVDPQVFFRYAAKSLDWKIIIYFVSRCSCFIFPMLTYEDALSDYSRSV